MSRHLSPQKITTLCRRTRPETSTDQSRQVATSPDLSRYVAQIENENTFLRSQVEKKDEQISSLLERDKETNFLIRGLQSLLALPERRDPLLPPTKLSGRARITAVPAQPNRHAGITPAGPARGWSNRHAGTAPLSNSYVSSKEVETARQLLAMVPFEDMPNFLGFALAEAQNTRFEVQTLGGLKQYLASYIERQASKQRASAAAQARQARDREEEEHAAYQHYRRQSALAVFANLPANEQAIIEELARAQSNPPGTRTGPLAGTLFEMAKVRITAERYAAEISTVDQWNAARRSPNQ